MAKSKVAPSKPITVPRLELKAAVLSIKVGDMLSRELEYENMESIYWTDSTAVLGYISNDSKRFHTFVCNRVETIGSSTTPDQWHYVPSLENPADIASRGYSISTLLGDSRTKVSH